MTDDIFIFQYEFAIVLLNLIEVHRYYESDMSVALYKRGRALSFNSNYDGFSYISFYSFTLLSVNILYYLLYRTV